MRGDDLPGEYQLSFWVGEVVRNDVYVETECRTLWSELRRAGVVQPPMQRNYGRLLPDVLTGLRARGVPQEFASLAAPVIEAAVVAHRERNQLAHDQWLDIPWSPGEVAGARGGVRRQVEEFAVCARGLLELTWRVRGVAIIAPAWFGHDAGAVHDRDDLWHWTRVAMGARADSAGEVRGSPGPAVLPPGW